MASDQPATNRRSYLGIAGTAAVAALAGCSGGGGGNGGDPQTPNHPVPHPEDVTVADSEATATALGGLSRPNTPQQSKDAVGYAHLPSDGSYCGNCSKFVPDQNGDGYGACVSVRGTIHRCDFCDLYSPYTGDDAVQCGE
ncbi:MAG: hypothetical protein ABEJ77_04935 [Halanaeroarchaeum sp.]